MARDSWKYGLTGLAGVLGGAAFVALTCRADAAKCRQETGRLHRVLVDLLLNALNAGDPLTVRHSRRVANLTDALARTYCIGGDRHSTLRLAALLHDMGKIDDRYFHILHSCDPLSKKERELINTHPGEGADILEPLEAIHPGLSRIVQAHHEWWDGNGYPAGLKGEEIPLGARLISVADVFDALTQPRPYREPLEPEQVFEELRKGSGTRFDPAVIQRLDRSDVRSPWSEIFVNGRREEATQASAQGSLTVSRPPP